MGALFSLTLWRHAIRIEIARLTSRVSQHRVCIGILGWRHIATSRSLTRSKMDKGSDERAGDGFKTERRFYS